MLLKILLEGREGIVRLVLQSTGDKAYLQTGFSVFRRDRCRGLGVIAGGRGTIALKVSEQIAYLLFIEVVQDFLRHERLRRGLNLLNVLAGDGLPLILAVDQSYRPE